MSRPCSAEDAAPGAPPLRFSRPRDTAVVGAYADHAALIALDSEVAATHADPEIRDADMAEAAEPGNARPSRVEQLKRHVVLNEHWHPRRDELMPTMKLKRKPIAEKCATQINALFH